MQPFHGVHEILGLISTQKAKNPRKEIADGSLIGDDDPVVLPPSFRVIGSKLYEVLYVVCEKRPPSFDGSPKYLGVGSLAET